MPVHIYIEPFYYIWCVFLCSQLSPCRLRPGICTMLFDGLHVRKEEIGDQGAGGTALVLFMVQHSTLFVQYLLQKKPERRGTYLGGKPYQITQ